MTNRRYQQHPNCASYLRCYPRDRWEMLYHQRALQLYAAHLGLSASKLYFDNGCPSAGYRPQLQLLAQAVAAGRHQVVLVPGPWVFCLDDTRARSELGRLSAHGCQVIELPAHWPHSRRRLDIPRPRSDTSRH